MTEHKATLQCARCGSTDLRAQIPAEELSAEKLMEMALAKMKQEQDEPAPAVVITKTEPPAAEPRSPRSQRLSVPKIIEEVEALERLDRSRWDVKRWLLPQQWIDWRSSVGNAKCEVCGGDVALGDAVRWLPQDRAPNHEGLTMHADCWGDAQRELD